MAPPHGHVHMIRYLKEQKWPAGTQIAEIGSMRECTPKCSTVQLGKICKDRNWVLITVDMDPKCIANAKRALTKIGCQFQTYLGKGEDWFNEQAANSVHAVYMDAFDIVCRPNHHSSFRKSRYEKFLDGAQITNEASYQMHLVCARACPSVVPVGGLVVFDDILDHNTWEGKGKLAIPFLIESGHFAIIEKPKHCVVMQKVDPGIQEST